MFYIGIDIAKFKHFASVVSSDGEVIVKPFPFENSRQGFMKLIEEIENFHDCLIGLESTVHYAENLIFFLYQRGYKIGLINPIQTDALRDSNIRKTKTDKIDTKLIVQCLILKKYSIINSFNLNPSNLTYSFKIIDIVKFSISYRNIATGMPFNPFTNTISFSFIITPPLHL